MARFRLQTALDVRERIEKLKQKEFAEQVQGAQKIKDKIEEIKNSIQLSFEEVNRSKQEGFTIAQLQFYEGYKQRLQYELKISNQQLKEKNQNLERKRRELIKASQNRRALEILKDKNQEENRRLEEKKERFELDEIAQNIVIRNRSQG